MGIGVAGPRIDPESFADDLTRRVLPGILNGEHTDFLPAETIERLGRVDKAAWLYRADDPQVHTSALLDAATQFRPPSNLVGADEAYAVLIGAVAFRAATSELLSKPDVHERYQQAASWVCVNLGSIIWWNCD